VSRDRRQIIAIGGLSPRTAEPFYRYILEQSPAARPRVGFLPTATGDADATVARFYEGFSRLSCRPAHLGLFGRVSDPAAFLRDQDVLLVAGGNTRSMLGLWREWGVDAALKEAWESGTLLAGFSAGAICWFAEALCDAWADRLVAIPGLGFLPGSCCPHYDGEAERRPAYHRLVARGEMQPGLGIGDDCAVHFRGLEPATVVTASPRAAACLVTREAGAIVEAPLGVPCVRAPREAATSGPGGASPEDDGRRP